MNRQATFVLSALFFIVSTSLAQTNVSGTVSGIWSLAGSPYVLIGDVNVPEMDTLTVESGVSILFADAWTFLMTGACIFNGSQSAPVEISGSGGGRFSIEAGIADWDYAIFHSDIEEIAALNGDLTITNSQLTADNTAKIIAENSDLILDNCEIAADVEITPDSYFLTAVGGSVRLANSAYSNLGIGLINTSDAVVEIENCAITYTKNDWYDCGTPIQIMGNSAIIIANDITYYLDVRNAPTSIEGKILYLDEMVDASVTENEFNGIIQCDENAEMGALIGIYGGGGRVNENAFDFHPEIPIGVTDVNIQLTNIENFNGEIDHNNFFVTSEWVENPLSQVYCIRYCNSYIHHNLVIANSSVQAFCIYGCEGEIINNTISMEGDLQLQQPHYAVAYSAGTIKNNVIVGIGEALHPYYNFIHIYNCFWGFSGGIPPTLGTGELFADPQIYPDYTLQVTSACLNSGDPSSPLDPDSTRADMGAFYFDQTDRPNIIAFGPTGVINPLEYTMEHFWIIAEDPTSTGLTYTWAHDGEIVSTDSTADIYFNIYGPDTVTACVYNCSGGDSIKWFFNVTGVNITLQVPGEFSTIQDAIDFASPSGDTIIVDAGTYYENLNMMQKSISLIGISGSESTIIDGDSSAGALHIAGLMGYSSIIRGLTFQNGLAEFGGGIYAENTSLLIEDVQVRNNVAASSSISYGGGIYLNDINAEMRDVTIENNVLICSEVGKGAGIYTDGFISMQSCYVLNNCIEEGVQMAFGGGIYHNSGNLLMEECIIRGNRISGGETSNGGGIRCTNANLRYTEITDNHALTGDNRKGGGIYASYSTIDNCTVALNEASEGAGVYITTSGNTTIHNSVTAFNNGETQIAALNASLITMSYSDTYTPSGRLYENCSPGAGCMELDPLFIGGDPYDVHLTASSPCINRGDPASPRDPDGTRADMGCYYYTPQAGISTEDPLGAIATYELYPPYPNPFNPITEITFDLPEAVPVRIEVFNVQGQKVVILADCFIPVGNHIIIWNAGDLPSGMYLIRMQAGTIKKIQKSFLIK